MKTKRNWSESREQHDLEGLRPGDDAEYCPRRVALQEGTYRQPGGQQSQSDMSYGYAEIGGEYDNRYAVHGAKQVATGDDEEQIADHDREGHHREQAYEDDGDHPGVLMLDPVEEHLDVVPADENYGAEEGQGRDCDRDVAYRV